MNFQEIYNNVVLFGLWFLAFYLWDLVTCGQDSSIWVHLASAYVTWAFFYSWELVKEWRKSR